MSNKKFFIIAGEASGDLLGSKLIAEIKQSFPQSQQKNLKFIGVGGKLMQEQGLKSIFDMNDLSVMGFTEVIPHIPKLLNRIKQTVDAILKENPDHLITIDSPDFSFRVVKNLKERAVGNSQLIKKFLKLKKTHLIAPSVWAYREYRAKKIAQLYDLLLAILPFEPPYFEKYGLKTVFIGNPIVEKVPDFAKKDEVNSRFRSEYGIKTSDLLIYLTPGSRNGEVKKMFPQFIGAINLLSQKHKNIKVAIALADKTKDLVKSMSQDLVVDYFLIDSSKKEQALFAANYALAKSGTNTLEISLFKVPMIICYRVNILTYFLARMLVKTKFGNLLNLILNREIIPELLQWDCEAVKIHDKMAALIDDKKFAQNQIDQSVSALEIMGLGSKIKASKKAADEILKI